VIPRQQTGGSVRIPAVLALLALTASCAGPPPQDASSPPTLAVALAAPVPLAAPPPVVVAAGQAPSAREVEYVPITDLWWRMLTRPAAAGRLMLSNFSFETTRVQAVLASHSVCAARGVGTVTEFVLPPNGTRVLPAPPGWDICWRRQLAPGEAREIPPEGPWTAWSRAYTGPGRFLDAVVVIPPPLPMTVAAVERAPAPPPPPVPPMVPK
jgi:hypothetical protein